MSQPGMPITALAPWFGGCRSIADRIGTELGDLAWCAVPFAGGMPELPWISTRAGIACDRHRHLINLARVVADDALLCRLIRRVERLLFHPDVLAAAQRRCVTREHERAGGGLFADGEAASGDPDVEWAADYFVCAWMGRGGASGRGGEFAQSLAVRYTAGGGGSAKRWRSAVESLPAWGAVLARWEFVCDDAFAVLARLRPQDRVGIYADPPWVGLGDKYTHRFTAAHHSQLARELRRLSVAGYRVVVRYGDDPLVRALYPESEGWTWVATTTRNQRGGDVAEALIVSRESYAGRGA